MSLLDRARGVVGIMKDEPEEESEENVDLSDFCPELSYQQRVVGFCICFAIGYFMTFFSFGYFVDLVEGDPVPFAVIYTVGNTMALMASMFLCGPKRQLKLMMDKKRKWNSIIYVTCLVCTIVLLFVPLESTLRLLLLIILVLIQFCAGIWYNLSYIPFGRRTLCKCLKGAMGVEDDGSNSII